jgi:alanine-glyoxylate transaminase/serine-glyoxylate transaminase/serine-pyruvate transaminase
LGRFNELMLMGTLSGVEMALDVAKAPHKSGGVLAAMEMLKAKVFAPLPTLQSAVA